MKKDIKYPNIVYCEEDPRLYDDYIQPLDCMDLRKVWSSYIPRDEVGKTIISMSRNKSIWLH